MALGFSGSNGGINYSQSQKENIMAVGFSGSNGGVGTNVSQFKFPLEISYFINNVCNLSCKHCYVGTKRNNNRLSVTEWKNVFLQCIELGALTFGNVGKEPTLSWDDTIELMQWFKNKSNSLPKLRYGMVTNGTLLTNERIAELTKTEPTYIDISFDGNKEQHNAIRGDDMYEKTRETLTWFPPSLMEKVFISFTANTTNLSGFATMMKDLYQLGVRQFLVSPYVSTEDTTNTNELIAENSTIVEFARNILSGKILSWDEYGDVRIYFKSDYTTSRKLMNDFKEVNIIDVNNLLLDDYGTIFNQYSFESNVVYFNYIPFDDSFIRSIRIGHDGYVSDCRAMFFNDEKYHHLAIGNVRQNTMKEILQRKFIV